jgi:hypothetical protein
MKTGKFGTGFEVRFCHFHLRLLSKSYVPYHVFKSLPAACRRNRKSAIRNPELIRFKKCIEIRTKINYLSLIFIE